MTRFKNITLYEHLCKAKYKFRDGPLTVCSLMSLLCSMQESLDSRHRLLCKQREDAKDLKDNLDRRENLVSTFLSRQLSAEQLQDYRRFVQTKASLLIRQKDLEEKQRLGEEQLEELFNSLNM